MALVIGMGNPQVFFPIPRPITIDNLYLPKGMGTAMGFWEWTQGPPIPLPVAGNPWVYY